MRDLRENQNAKADTHKVLRIMMTRARSGGFGEESMQIGLLLKISCPLEHMHFRT